MSIIISGIKADINTEDCDVLEKVCKEYGVFDAKVYKKSIDARKGEIKKVVSVIANCENEHEKIEKYQNIKEKTKFEEFKPCGTQKMQERPIVIGFGPAGLLCAYELAKNGYEPRVFELGEDIDSRDKSVENFFKNGVLNKKSNVQFGEGGAGSYSDGKLTTRTNDVRCEYILNLFHKFGADEEILYLAKPHIGTDVLKKVVKNIRQEIIRLGGEINFNSKLTDLNIKNDKLIGISINNQEMNVETVVLAIGHSARDTFEMLNNKKVFIEPKSFAVGARIEHLQEDIDKSLYGKHAQNPNLPIGEYNLSNTKNGRGCYTFCMCPGGLVVPASSEENTIVTNGMSYHARNNSIANSALVVSVTPRDYGEKTPLDGMYFQREIEKRAFNKNYYAPTQLIGDFLDKKPSKKFGNINPSYEIGTYFCDLDDILPDFVTNTMRDTLPLFAKKMNAFGVKSAILTAPETRTSSPIRITRNDNLESINIKGLMPCGEGAGYAGGIMSAGVDGLKCAEKIMNTWRLKF
ncbi:MAG: FAD-dependent oxidoreductase [Clostridia bacterium]